MLEKKPQPAYKRFIAKSLKTIFVVEIAAITVCYGLYFKLNTDRDIKNHYSTEFRLYMYKNHNWALEGYYGLGEKIGGLKSRELDYKVWKNEGKI